MPNAGGLTDREAAIDALIRFVRSIDKADASLCESSLTDDMTMDLTPIQQSSITGKADVVTAIMTKVGTPLDTTHMATNIRCFVTGDEAELTCCVLAQHFRAGQGPKPEVQDHWLMGNEYDVKIVRVGDLWRISKLVFTPTWTLGNYEVMKV